MLDLNNAGLESSVDADVYLMLIMFIHTLMLDFIFHLSLIVDLVLPFAMFGHI